MRKPFLFLLLLLSFSFSAGAQHSLKGTVSDSGGDPLPGAAIKIVGTDSGVITDANGAYETPLLRFPARIVVSYIGYSDTEIELTGNEPIPYNIVLDDSGNLLDEVVVVGFGTQKRSTLSGAVGIVDGSTLNERPVVSAANALQGADPSVYISTSNGSANSSASINIRGTLSVNGGSPLVLIDGVEGSLSMLNPNDIESVSILKDASTCAIYGAKASAGVVLVTTKQGSTGRPKVSYGFRQGWIQPTTDMDLITTGYDHISIINYFQQHSFHSSRFNEYDYTVSNGELLKLFERRNDKVENPARPWVEAGPDGYYHYYGNFDWFNYFYNTNRPVSEHDFSVSGGSGGIRYYVGGRYYNETGLLKGSLSDKFRSYSVRSKVTARVNRYISFTSNISYAKKNYAWQGNSDMESTFENLWRYGSPAFSPYNPDGSLVNYPIELAGAAKTNMMNNAATQALSGSNHNSKDTGHLTMTGKVDFTPVRGVTVTGQYDFRRIDDYNTYRTGKYYWSNQPGIVNEMTGTTNSYKEDRDWRQVHVGTLTAQYENNWGGHYMKALAGVQYEASHSSDLAVKGSPVLVDGYDSFALIDQSADDNGFPRASYAVSNSSSEYATLGFFGRVNYDYKGRYIFEASARYDGSSRFGAHHRWGFFPSGSVAWKFSDERFFNKLRSVVSEGKVRLSAGSLGNQQVSNYYYIEKISVDNTQDYTFDGKSKSRYASISSPVSGNLTWETVNTYDAGLDLSFFNNRLKFVGDFYIRDTKDMLTSSVALPEVFGATEPKENCADLRTYGWEIALTWRDSFMLLGKKLHYTVAAYLGDRHTYFTKYYNPTGTLDSNYVGKELGTIWGFRSGGLFASDEEAREDIVAVDSRQYQPGYYYPGGGVCIDGEGPKAGDFKLLDIGGGPDGQPDGVISTGNNTLSDHGDLEIIGTTQPHYNYSFRLEMDWNGFDFSAFFQGIGHKDWYPTGAYGGYAFWGPYSSTSVTFIHKRFMDNVWSPENPDSNIPAIISNNANDEGRVSTYLYEDHSFAKLRNLSLGYSLNSPKIKSLLGFERLRLYVREARRHGTEAENGEQGEEDKGEEGTR